MTSKWNRHTAYPEALPDSSGPWVVEEDKAARVDFSKQEMWVPLKDDFWSRATRLHELTHHISPREGPGEILAAHPDIDETCLMVAEDIRVNTRLLNAGSAVSRELNEKSFIPPNEIARAVERIEELEMGGRHRQALVMTFILATGLVNTYKDGVIYGLLCKLLDAETGHSIACALEDTASGDFDSTLNLARKLTELLDEEKEAEDPKGSLRHSMSSIPPTGVRTETPYGIMEELARMFGPPEGRGFGKWGKMEIHNFAKHPNPGTRRVGKRSRMSDSGADIGRLDRLYDDGRVFRNKARRHGGAVLIDCSSSMSISPKQVEDLVNVAPFATVASYSAAYNDGRLSILARNKRISRDIRKDSQYGSGNVVDGPALLWLAGQIRPLVWVSDGVVTGVGDRIHTNLNIQARKIIRRFAIKRVESLDKALPLFKALRRR